MASDNSVIVLRTAIRRPWALGRRAFLPATLVAALILRGLILAADAVPFNADEAVVALMAKHILAGERPVFFYGQAYMGSLDAWLVALAFVLMGPSVMAVRAVQTVLYMGLIATTYLLGRRLLREEWAARAAALVIAFPPVLLTLYTTASLGGYGETLLLGTILLLLGHRLAHEDRDRPGRWLLFGLLAGLGFWTFGLILVYLVPLAAFLLVRGLWRQWKAALLAGIGFLVGGSPWWEYVLTHGAVALHELGGSAIAGASSAGPLENALVHTVNLVLFGLPALAGLRPPWSVEAILPLLAVPALVIWLRVGVFMVAQLRLRSAWAEGAWPLLVGVCATLITAFILTPFGADPSGRYFLPLYAPLALGLGALLSRVRATRPGLAWVGLVVVLGYNLAGNVWAVAHNPPGLTTQFDPISQLTPNREQELVDFLLAHGGARGYSNYWVTFPIAFLSDERVILSAELPYKADLRYTPRDNRYAPYREAVQASPTAVYVTTNHPPLDARIRERLHALGVTFKEHQIGSYHIFYDLSRKVLPDALGIYR